MSSLETYSINLNNYLNQYLAYARAPITRLQNQKSDLQIKYAIFTDLSSKLSELESAAERLSGTGTYSVLDSKDVTSSDTNVVTAIAAGSAVTGSHTVFVTQLAKAHTVVSDRYDQDDTSLSSSHSGTKSFSISVNGETYDVSVAISVGETDQTVISNIASAIIDATDGEISASLVLDTPSTAKLSIRSASSGTEGKMTFTDTDGLLASLGVTNGSEATDTVGGYVYADLGDNELDAKATIDGINIIASTNVVENVIHGLTLTLLTEHDAAGSAATLTVSIDIEEIKSEIQDFVTAYNDAYTYLAQKTMVDGTTYERGPLSTEYPYISLRSSMRQAMVSLVSGTGSDYQSLSQIGITSNRSGYFSISDTDLLEEVIATDLDALGSVFTSTDGIATAMESLLSGYTDLQGTISVSQDGINSRIDVIESRIEHQEYYVSIREKALRNQYAALQEALYVSQMNQSMASSFAKMLGL
jgi:flagellar hook-associated protein 2